MARADKNEKPINVFKSNFDKILDIVGDLFLLGGNVIGHYEGFRTGHMLNDQLLSAILSQPKAFSIETFEEGDSPIQFYSEGWQNDL